MISFMNDTTFILILLGTMVVTYIPRMLPLVLLSKTTLPLKVEQFLDNIPIAILGSLLLSSLVMNENDINISLNNEFLIVGVLTIVFARYVKRIDFIVVFGILTMIIYRIIF